MKFQSALSTSTAKYSRLLNGGLKGQVTSSASITKKRRHLEVSLKSYLTFFAPTLNQFRRFGEGLKIQLVFTNFIAFEIDFDIFDFTPSSAEPLEIGYSLWHRYCCYAKIKDLTPTIRSFYKYT